MADYVNLLAALVACLSAFLGLGSFLHFRSKRDRLNDINDAFIRASNNLGSDDPIKRLAAAGVLPRFFDAKSQYGLKGAPYANDAITLMTAVLRVEPTGVVQKTLADGLAQADSLAGRDFQKANLRDCYWGRKKDKKDEKSVDASGADFYRADLTRASLRGAVLQEAQFKNAQLVATVFENADLRKCNFDAANLRGATFDGARLTAASFVNASNIPSAIKMRLNESGSYTGEDPFLALAGTAPVRNTRRVFLSRPSQCDRQSNVLIFALKRALTQAGLELVTLPPGEYGVGAPLDEIKQRISTCDAVIILGVPQIAATQATWHPGTGREFVAPSVLLATPWNHIEAGIAAALDKPLLVIRDGVSEGVFAVDNQPYAVRILDFNESDSLPRIEESIAEWVTSLHLADPDEPTEALEA